MGMDTNVTTLSSNWTSQTTPHPMSGDDLVYKGIHIPPQLISHDGYNQNLIDTALGLGISPQAIQEAFDKDIVPGSKGGYVTELINNTLKAQGAPYEVGPNGTLVRNQKVTDHSSFDIT